MITIYILAFWGKISTLFYNLLNGLNANELNKPSIDESLDLINQKQIDLNNTVISQLLESSDSIYKSRKINDDLLFNGFLVLICIISFTTVINLEIIMINKNYEVKIATIAENLKLSIRVLEDIVEQQNIIGDLVYQSDSLVKNMIVTYKSNNELVLNCIKASEDLFLQFNSEIIQNYYGII
jgi:hypothetical protein